MRLPDGVAYNPRQDTLIAKDGRAQISIETTIKINEHYQVTDSVFDYGIEKRLKGDWEQFDLLFHLSRRTKIKDDVRPAVVRSAALHGGTPQLPSITVIPNLATDESSGISRPYTVLGCDFGRYLDSHGDEGVREVVEFATPGMMIIGRNTGELDLWVGRDGDKVVLSAGSHTTLYNLGDADHPLVVLDYANPCARSVEDPDIADFGPPLLAYYDDLEAVFVINRLYVDNPDMRNSLHAPHAMTDSARTIRLPRTSRQDLGSFLEDQFAQNAELISRFAKFGINVRHADRDVMIEPLRFGGALKLFFSRPLTDAVKEGTKVYRFFYPKSRPAEPIPAFDLSAPRPTAPVESPAARPLSRPLVLVVEGAGDWVEQTYRKAFIAKVDENRDGESKVRLSVFYADDTRWKKKPDWAENALQDWETYLDKADPDDYVRYSHLRPDAVFVVTPDSMHSTTAAFWIDKTPVVFIEKPFDSDVRNVERLRFSYGRRQTEIVGLDHYQFYAGPLRKLRDTVAQVVGDALLRIDFVLAEHQAIEMDRERSLRHGLTLDLLPHFLALLTFFGDIRSIDEITVPGVWRYTPLEAWKRDKSDKRDIEDVFLNETAAVVHFTIEDKSRNGFRVPCRAVIGKGFEKTVKFMEVTGITGNALRIDLSTDPTTRPTDVEGYPWKSLFFLDKIATDGGIQDPYDPMRKLHLSKNRDQQAIVEELEPRYETLLNDLLKGTQSASISSLSITQGGQIVQALDRIWWAVQKSRPWQRHSLGKLDPMTLLKEND